MMISCAVLERHVVKELLELKGMVKELQGQVALLLKRKGAEEYPAQLPEDVHLPLQTVADVEAIHALDESKQEALVRKRICCDGVEW